MNLSFVGKIRFFFIIVTNRVSPFEHWSPILTNLFIKIKLFKKYLVNNKK